MRNSQFDIVESTYERPNALDFEVGDTVVVSLRITEGTKERLQNYEGTVISRRAQGMDEMFTVRRIVHHEGVERVFPLHSPRIAGIKTKRSGRIRRCKLYYLRERVGKSQLLKLRRMLSARLRARLDSGSNN